LQEWTKVNVAAQKLVGLLPGGKLPSDQVCFRMYIFCILGFFF